MRIAIPIYDGVNVLDVMGPLEMFHWAEIDVVLVAKYIGSVRCMEDVNIAAQSDFANSGDFEVIWVPGGEVAALNRLMYGTDRSYLDYIAKQGKNAQFVCSVCEGALLLAATGLLDGYSVTTHWAFTKCLKDRFKKVTVVDGHPRFWRDRNRLTGGGISAGLDEALELIQMLKGTAKAQNVQLTTQYYPEPPVKSHIPSKEQDCPLGPPPSS
jgi:transcriptional regulator GlxA family with amidase domain